MNTPENLKYTNDHEWVKIEDQIATVGITDFAQGELGEIVYVELEHLQESLEVGDVFGSIEAVKTVSEVFMPLSGKIIAINEQLEDEPELVNSAPYEEGWMIKIAISNPQEKEFLLDAPAYTALIS